MAEYIYNKILGSLTGAGPSHPKPSEQLPPPSAGARDGGAKRKTRDHKTPAPVPPGDAMEVSKGPPAEIKRIYVGTNPDNSKNFHTVVKIPSDIATPLRNIEFYDRLRHSKHKNPLESGGTDHTVYNLLMVDGSGSMTHFFYKFLTRWNNDIAPMLDGETDIYSFSDKVEFRRSGVSAPMKMEDFQGRMTDFAGAIRVIGSLVKQCPHHHVRVFLVTDGDHTVNRDRPEDEIQDLSVPPHKRVELYLLGINRQFPVNFSIQIRSKLHTGAADVPPLFWIIDDGKNLDEDFNNFQSYVKKSVKLNLSISARLVPYLDDTRSFVYPGEYIYFEHSPEVLLSNLKLTEDDSALLITDPEWRKRVTIKENRHDDDDHRSRYERRDMMMMHMMMKRERMRDRRHMRDYDEYDRHHMKDYDDYDDFHDSYEEFYGMPRKRKVPEKRPEKKPEKKKEIVPKRYLINPNIQDISPSDLMNKLCKQWSSTLLQRHKNKSKVPLEAFDFMETAFKYHLGQEQDLGDSLHSRLSRKATKAIQMEFDVIMKETRQMIATESKYANEIQLAEAVMKTAVQSKHDLKLLRYKGHGDEQWQKDTDEFGRIFQDLESRIKQLPEPTPDDCCKIVTRSLLTDLQDPEFRDLLKCNKMDFLQDVTFTGIPIFAPVKSSSQINPWTQYIKNICVMPFDVLSQRAMETVYANENVNKESPDKEIQLQQGNANSVFNVIVPIIPKEHAELLKPIVRSNVFAVGATFCILKNPLIVDFNCHIASLGCVWMKSIKDHPVESRPHFIKKRIASIEATAKLYLDRETIAAYIEVLLKWPATAVCTEAEQQYQGVTLKCESLIKPAFFLHLSRNNLPLLQQCQANICLVIEYILLEFLGRCLASYESKTPYMDFYLPAVSDEDAREVWVEEKAKELVNSLQLSGDELVKEFYEPDEACKHLEPRVNEIVEKNKDAVSWQKMCEHEQEGARMDVDDPRRHEEGGSTTAPIYLKPNMEKIRGLHNYVNTGNIRWEDLEAWAHEMLNDLGGNPVEDTMEISGGTTPGGDDNGAPGGTSGGDADAAVGGSEGGFSDAPQATTSAEKLAVPPQARPVCLIQQDIDFAFGSDMLNVYLVQAIRYRTSRKRTSQRPSSPEEAREYINTRITEEWDKNIKLLLRPKVDELVLKVYMDAYTKIHSVVARPMSRRQIIEEAQQLGVAVTEENFDNLYRYRVGIGLSRNSCHSVGCPHYLIPNRRCNAHLAAERRDPNFPHNLHAIVARNPDNSVERSVDVIRSGTASGTHKRKKHDRLMNTDGSLEAYVEELGRKYEEFKHMSK